MFFLLLAVIIPIVLALMNGSTYTVAFSLVGVGIVLYFMNIVLTGMFISKRAPETLEDDTWDDTAGTGIVPKWVSVIGLIGMGFVPAGVVVTALLWMGLVFNRVGG